MNKLFKKNLPGPNDAFGPFLSLSRGDLWSLAMFVVDINVVGFCGFMVKVSRNSRRRTKNRLGAVERRERG